MPLQNSQYDAIMREYSRRQSRNARILSERRAALLQKIPRLAEIENETASLSSRRVREMLTGGSPETHELRASLKKLDEEKKSLLQNAGLPTDYLSLPCDCPLCRDTGFINGQKCSCFRKLETDLLYTQSSLSEVVKKERFDTFSLSYYSDEIRDPVSGLTQRALAKKALESAAALCDHLSGKGVPGIENLFLYGDTGVGKTFLSHAAAGQALLESHPVLYFSAFDLFDQLAGKQFYHRETEDEEDLIYDCDLLIIDDLGTELTNSFVSSALFQLVNERILKNRSTIISTNLNLQDFSEVYSERTFSRIASHYCICKLAGKDIRIQKKFAGGF